MISPCPASEHKATRHCQDIQPYKNKNKTFHKGKLFEASTCFLLCIIYPSHTLNAFLYIKLRVYRLSFILLL